MSLYQKGVFLVKGLREFTKSGYIAAEKSFNAKDLGVDVKGRSYMITGSNSGIGKSAAIEIAKKGGTIHMVCRNSERADKAKDEIVTASGNQDVHVHILDMSKLSEVHKFAHEFSTKQEKLDTLINNAGCMVNDRTMTSDNLEMNFATNTMGTYVLTISLLPLLKKASKPRVITVSSGGMYIQKLNVKNLQSEHNFSGELAYAHNKRQQVILTEELAKLHPDVHFSTMHPGWADTPAVRSSMPDFHRQMGSRLRSPEQGADTIVWLALSNMALEQKSGQFFLDRKSQALHLPLAWTRESASERAKFMEKIDEILTQTKPSDL
uniref:dehydrogenase/reductase SDR family member 12-like n=1 Tax=Styela clava TaxID=7725 RepID=UPI001939FD7C|nr:dehydrogenase/reductase SDR family member 12-like [Styela clava]